MSERATDHSRHEPARSRHRQTGPGRVRARLGVLDLLLYLWRARLLMFLVFFLFVLIGLAVTQLFPAKAIARARVLVEMPPDISMSMRSGEAARIEIRPDAASAEAEVERARALAYAQAAISEVGAGRLLEPGIGGAFRQPADQLGPSAADFLDRLAVHAVPGSSAVELRFGHPHGDVAVDALDAYVRAYVSDRNELEPATLRGARQPDPGDSADTLEAVNAQILGFMDAYNVSNLDAEIAAADAALAVVSSAQIDARSALSGARGRARELEAELAKTDAEIELFVETVSTDRQAALASERDQMQARFGSDHPVVRELDAQIAIAREAPAQVLSADRRRTGPNPVRQYLMREAATARAEVAALVRQGAALETQRLEAEQRRRALAALEPEWRALQRRLSALEAAPTTPAPQVEVEHDAGETVTVLEAAQLLGGRRPGLHLAAWFAALGAIAALAAGLIRGWLAPGLPGAGAAERTLGLRVLASIRDA